eukprot:scaffold13326_cov127-Isochrysis_galbana.AAC.8
MYEESGFFGAFGSFLALVALVGAPPVFLAVAVDSFVLPALFFGALEEPSRGGFEIDFVTGERA